jgi:Xaa-Pro dipeptidase
VILFDLVAEVRGYHSDISRTFAFGDSSRRFQQIYRVVRQAQEEGFRAARPGIPAGKVDEAARSAVQRNGFGRYFTHRVGHGLGLEAHEEPYLGGGNKLVLEDGMTVTVGPGIYLPGEFGVRLVDVVLVTATGPRVLSAPPAPPV